MVLRTKYIILILVLIGFSVFIKPMPSYAVLSMSEIKYLFEQEKGYSWDQANSQEKKDFIRDVQGREEYQEGEFKGKQQESDTEEQRYSTIYDGREKKRAPYRVRASFEAEKGIEWDEADEQEKKDFWKEYKIDEKVADQEEKLRDKQIEIDEKQRIIELKLRKQKLKIERKLREQDKKLRRQELKRKRQEEKRKRKLKELEWEAYKDELQLKREKSKQPR